MSYRYRATEPFWESFYDLHPEQKELVRHAWRIFKVNPFDPRLETHKIHHLSAIYKRAVYAVKVGADLRVAFIVENDTVWSLEVGTHDIYKK